LRKKKTPHRPYANGAKDERRNEQGLYPFYSVNGHYAWKRVQKSRSWLSRPKIDTHSSLHFLQQKRYRRFSFIKVIASRWFRLFLQRSQLYIAFFVSFYASAVMLLAKVQVRCQRKGNPHQPFAKPMGEKGFGWVRVSLNIKNQLYFSTVSLLSQVCEFWGGGRKSPH
jgi:hypothetical protein